MTVKQPPLGQIPGRGKRISATESHFNMACLDEVRQEVPKPRTDEDDLNTYGQFFDNVYKSGEKQ
jgi:hypothetical protein